LIDWWQWRNEPVLIDGIVLAGWVYALLAGPFRRRLAPGEPFPRVRACRFYAALGLLYLAVASPWDRVGENLLFSVHMLQLLAIMYPAAALFLAGLPAWMIDPALGCRAWRRPLGWILSPVACGALFTLVVTAWHVPRLFESALESEGMHAAEHASIFAVSLLFWWPLLSPSRVFPPIGFGGRLIYLFCLEVSLTALFTYILMADHVMYPTYEYAPRILPGLAAVDDQVLGGILLSAVSSLVMVAALGVNFFRWARTNHSP